MIKIIQKVFRNIVTQQRIHFHSQLSLTKHKGSLNYIPSFHCSFQKQQNYITIDCFGNVSLNSNMSQSQALQEWQKDIIIQIKQYPIQKTDKMERVYTLCNLVDLYETYMNCLIHNDKFIFSIDKQINDFLEIQLSDIELLQSNEGEINYIDIVLYKLKIQANFLQNFEKIELSEKIKLYQQYQHLHENILEIEEKNYQMIKIKSCITAQTLFIYLAQKWIQNKVEPNGIRQIEFVKYALEQLVKIFDELQTINAQDQEKIRYISTVIQIIYFIFNYFQLFYFIETKYLIQDVILKTQKTIHCFQNILPFEQYISCEIQFIMDYIKLGQSNFQKKILQLF